MSGTTILQANLAPYKRQNLPDGGIKYTSHVGEYCLSPLQGNRQIGISHGVIIYPHVRGQGYGQAQHEDRLKEAYRQGHRALLCTVNPANNAEKHILAKNGWKKVADICWCPLDNQWVELWLRQLGEMTHTHIQS